MPKKQSATRKKTAKKKTTKKASKKAGSKKKASTKKASAKKAGTKKASKKKTTTKATQPKMAPPQAVRSALKRGLELRHDYGGKGLRAHTIREAEALAQGKDISEAKARKMNAWFARHQVDKRPGWTDPPTPGYVAWLLWGGDPGRSWSKRLVSQLDKAKG